MPKGIIAFASGAYAAFLNFWGSTYVETALKGLIGGVMGYLGTVLMTWAVKKIKEKIKQRKTIK